MVVTAVAYVIYADAQPSGDAWTAARELAQRWNGGAHESRWELIDAGRDSAIELLLDEDTLHEQAELDSLLADYRERRDVEVRRHVTDVPSADDYAEAPFVHLYGVELQAQSLQVPPPDAGHTRFVVNDDDAWRASDECPSCGFVDPEPCQRDDFVIEEWFLDHAVDEETGVWTTIDRPWDVISLPGAALLLSMRALDDLREHGIDLSIRDVLTGRGGARSGRVAQVNPERWLVGVCPEHSSVDGEQCPECGRIFGRIAGRVHLRANEVGDADAIGRLAGLRLLYLSQRVHERLSAIDANGLTAGRPIYLCDHEVGG